MATLIKARTFSSVVDNRAQLSNSNFARLWSSDIGTTWNKIRIGFRISMTDSGGSMSSTPKFAFGISSGTSNIFMDATTTHWLGALSNMSIWTRTAGPPVQYTMNGAAGASIFAAKKINTTTTIGSALAGLSGSGTFIVTLRDATTANRGVIFLDITKGSPNFTLAVTIYPWANSSTDVSVAAYLTQLSIAVPSLPDHVNYEGTTATVAVDEATNGYFNAINIAWDRSDALIEISDIAVVRFS